MIKVEHLSKSYSYYNKQKGIVGAVENIFQKKILYKEAVKDVSFEIPKGQIAGLIGLNGAGKTTLLKMLSGILRPSSGKIDIMGYVPFDKEYNFLNQISMVMGNKSQLWWDLPAIDTFELNSKIFHVDSAIYKKALDELVEALGVQDLINVQVRRLSLGERMKMEIIAALIHSPSLIFLDEPTIGLDVLSQNSIRQFLRNYCEKSGITIILTSHNFEDFVSLAQRLLLIDNGKILLDTSYEEFLETYSTNKIITIKVHDESGIYDAVSRMGRYLYKIISRNENELKFSVNNKDANSVVPLLFENNVAMIKDFNIEDMDLKDIVINIYQNEWSK